MALDAGGAANTTDRSTRERDGKFIWGEQPQVGPEWGTEAPVILPSGFQGTGPVFPRLCVGGFVVSTHDHDPLAHHFSTTKSTSLPPPLLPTTSGGLPEPRRPSSLLHNSLGQISGVALVATAQRPGLATPWWPPLSRRLATSGARSPISRCERCLCLQRPEPRFCGARRV